MNLDLSSDCNVHGSSILREIEYFLKNETQDDFGHQHFYDDLYKEDIENFSLGFISKEDIQIDDIYHIEIQENYVVISFVYVSMMVCEEDVERFLTEKLTKIRLHLFTNMHCNCLDLLAEKELGIKIHAFAAIGGYDYFGRSAIVYSPEYIKNNRII